MATIGNKAGKNAENMCEARQMEKDAVSSSRLLGLVVRLKKRQVDNNVPGNVLSQK